MKPIAYSNISDKTKKAATKKAQTIKPRVRIEGQGHFIVWSSTNIRANAYTVRFGQDTRGLIVGCTCDSANCCYHIAACAPLFKQQVFERSRSLAAL